jgi:hypothetical protein
MSLFSKITLELFSNPALNIALASVVELKPILGYTILSKG